METNGCGRQKIDLKKILKALTHQDDVMTTTCTYELRLHEWKQLVSSLCSNRKIKINICCHVLQIQTKNVFHLLLCTGENKQNKE